MTTSYRQTGQEVWVKVAPKQYRAGRYLHTITERGVNWHQIEFDATDTRPAKTDYILPCFVFDWNLNPE